MQKTLGQFMFSFLSTKGGAALLLVFLTVLAPIPALGNPVENPGMEGDFISQGSLGEVAEGWTGWVEEKDSSYELGEFHENSDANYVRGGGKSQEIYWWWIWGGFGYNSIYQQVDNLQAGGVYRASFWFKVRHPANARNQSCDFYGGIGVDPNGGVHLSGWSVRKESLTRFWPYGGAVISPWRNVSRCFSPNGTEATVFIITYGYGWAEDLYWDPWWQDLVCCQSTIWELHCYIDDVVIEPVQIGAGSTVEATSDKPANGVGRSEVTITVVDSSGEPLSGIPASEISVECTGGGNTIVGPRYDTDANGMTTAYVTSRVSGTKTVSVRVFDRLLSDTAVVEFVGGPFGPIWYVDADATGTDDGSSWADAFNDLQDGLVAAQSGQEIRVAEGIYRPNLGIWVESGGRRATFQLINGVTIKGGYAGFGEADPHARDIDKYETILSGDRYGNDVEVDDPCDLLAESSRGENSYHVVTGSGTDETAVLEGFTITAGNAKGSSHPHNIGAGMIIETGSPTLIDCSFTANSALQGGGLANQSARPALNKCTFSSNQAESGGGGMSSDTNSSATVTDCEFRDNVAEFGGGMRNYDSNGVVTNCTFSGNRAECGGGMHNQSSSPTVTGCSFTGNSAVWGGGMRNNNSSPTVTNCTFSGNSATNGGGQENEGNGIPTVTNCTFNGNSADYGGGVLNFSSSPTVTNCTFSGNSAGQYGGGTLDYQNSPTLANCAFSGNRAALGGGAMGLEGSTAVVTNCTFRGNLAVSGSTVACDSEPQQNASDVAITNCILWDGSNGIWNNDGSTISITYSDVEGGWAGSGNMDADPCFVDGGYWDANGTPGDSNDDFWLDGDYHLQPDSPCIDAGDPCYVADANEFDLDGNPRVVGNIIDMGAYEYVDWSINLIEINGPTQVSENSGAQYTCIAYYDDGNSADVTDSVNWDDNSPYASVDSSGYLTSGDVLEDQSCQITAEYDGQTDTHNLTITYIPVVTSIVISGPSQVNESSGAQYTCTAYYDDGSHQDVTNNANWSENSDCASIDDSGYLTTGDISSEQLCRVTAEYGGESAVYDVTIELQAVDKFGSFGGQKNIPLTVDDCDGRPVTFMLSGGGYGEIAGGCDFTEVALYHTTDKSNLTIKTKGTKRTSVGDIIVHGSLRTISAKTTDLRGNITIDGSVGKIEMADIADDHTITIGPSSNPKAAALLKFDRISDLSIDSDIPIKVLMAAEWLDNDANADEITAPWLGTLQIRGDKRRRIAGNFQADLDLDGTGAQKATLTNAKIAGGLSNCKWDIDGDVRTVYVKGEVTNWDLDIHSSIRSLKLGDVADTYVSVDGLISSLHAARWLGGHLEAASINSLQIKGDRKLKIAGDFSADVTLTGTGVDSRKNVLNNARIAGEVIGGTWSVTGNGGGIAVGGSRPDWTVSFSGDVRSLMARGNKKDRIDGNLSGTWVSDSLKAVSAAGDIADAHMTLNQTPDAKLMALGKMISRGWVRDSRIISCGNIGAIMAGAIRDSSCFAGVTATRDTNGDDVLDLPSSASDFDLSSGGRAMIKNLKIKGIKGQSNSIINSNIAAADFGIVYLAYPQYDNGGMPFGVAADFIKKIIIKDAGGKSTKSNLDDPGESLKQDDAEIRLF
ncbi:MAG: Ig-like domain-containing protein [Planctomycetota bacterium]|jgi:hypothetical protein